MIAKKVTRYEVYLSAEEEQMLSKVVEWIDDMEKDWDDVPEHIQGMLIAISTNISDLLEMYDNTDN